LALEAKMNVWMNENNTEEWPSLEQLGIKSIEAESTEEIVDVKKNDEELFEDNLIDLNDLIDDDNNVNWELFEKITDDFFAKENIAFNLKTRPEKHVGEKFTIEHIKNVVETARKIKIPNSIDRKELILAALLHDVGKPYRNEDHGLDGIAIIKKLFKNKSNYKNLNLAIRHHMNL
jgi:HD-GYP domain-containing protein (c-di-GMP phosphodiesterase class II)